MQIIRKLVNELDFFPGGNSQHESQKDNEENDTSVFQ